MGVGSDAAGNATPKPFTQAGASRFVVGEEAAEHGGFRPENRHVPIVVWGAGIRSNVADEPVDTNQIAPTILSELGLKPHELQAVQIEGTKRLPHPH